jgi:hypothetical protein
MLAQYSFLNTYFYNLRLSRIFFKIPPVLAIFRSYLPLAQSVGMYRIR